MPTEEVSEGSRIGDSDGEQEGAPLGLRDCLLSASTEAELLYRVAALHLEAEGGGEQSCNLIPIAELDGSVLVAVPHSAWHRVANRRYLPRAGLLKPCHAEVLAASPSDRTKPHAHFKVRVWMGLLASALERHVVVGEEDQAAERVFVVSGSERAIMPFGPSLASIARDHFSFVSAAEEAAPREPEDSDLAARVQGVEQAVQGLQGGLDAILREVSGRGGQSASADLRNVGAVSSRGKAKAQPPPSAPVLTCLDPSVVAAARAAGVPESQLQLMDKLALKPGKLGDGSRVVKNVLSESEEEEAREPGVEGEPGTIAGAICKMTHLLSKLSGSKRAGSLEDLLDRSEGAELGQSASSSGGSSKTAAYQKLVRLLKEDPAKISSSVLRLMSEDFQGHTAAPGPEGVNLTTRAWLEHRSRVQQFAGPVRWGWQTAGALDALLAGREEECKARLCLMLCALDQSALDGGSWLLASEMLLESPPPLSSFSKHRSPEPGESHQTKVMDPRWISLLMHRIRERESFIEARKKLSAPRGPSAPNPDAERDKPEKPSKGRGKAKATE